MIKFSIIIPVYNVEKYLDKCFESIIKQSYKNYEVIIVCDKCEDNSELIVDKYVKNNENFIKIYEVNTGLSLARNIGLKLAKGDYLLFLDSDDYYDIDLLQILNDNLKEQPDIIRFQVRTISNEIIEYNETPFDTTDGITAFNNISKYHFIENAWCYCYNKKYWLKNKYFYQQNCLAEDFGLTPIIIGKANKVKSISYIGYNYVQRPKSLMNNTNYEKRIKKMEDMIFQSTLIKNELNDNKYNVIKSFVNNSLILFSTSLKYKDYKIYNKKLRQLNCFKELNNNSLKSKIKNICIKINSYLFYNLYKKCLRKSK